MSDARGLTIASLGAFLGVIGANLGVFDYIGAKVLVQFHHPQAVAVLVGILAGVAYTTWIPYCFGPFYCAARLKVLLRVSASVLTFAISWRLHPTEAGLYWALIAAFAGAQIYMLIAGAVYRLWPRAEPKALQPSPIEECAQ